MVFLYNINQQPIYSAEIKDINKGTIHHRKISKASKLKQLTRTNKDFLVSLGLKLKKN